MRYTGGKGGAGVYQTIINQFPPHRVYIEPFVGGGNVFERKAPAASSVLADLDPRIVAHWRHECRARPDVEVLQASALELLASRKWVGDELVYLVPPYLHSTRKDVALYRFEMSDADHARLLELASEVPAMVAISGYRSGLYDDAASRFGWRRVDFQAMTRRGPATESLWLNYPTPAALADYAHVGRDYRERERIKRKAARWVRRFEQLPQLERGAIADALQRAGALSTGQAVTPGAAVVDVDHRRGRRGSIDDGGKDRRASVQMALEYLP